MKVSAYFVSILVLTLTGAIPINTDICIDISKYLEPKENLKFMFALRLGPYREICLAKNLPLVPKLSMSTACAEGDIDLLELWKESNLPLEKYVGECFPIAAQSGRVDILEWLKYKSGMSRDAYSAALSQDHNRALLKAAYSGHVNALNWLKAEETVDADFLWRGFVIGMPHEAKILRREIFEWFEESVGSDIVLQELKDSQHIFARYGDLELLIWAKNSLEDFKIEPDMIYPAVQNGDVQVLDFIRNELGQDELRRYFIDRLDKFESLFIRAISSGNLKVMEWLKNEFEITEEEFQDCLLKLATYGVPNSLSNGYVDIATWFKHESGLTREEFVKILDNDIGNCFPKVPNLESLKFLKQELSVERFQSSLVRRMGRYMDYLVRACDIKFLEWLKQESGLSTGDFFYRVGTTGFRSAVLNNRMKVLNWVKNYMSTEALHDYLIHFVTNTGFGEHLLDRRVLTWLKTESRFNAEQLYDVLSAILSKGPAIGRDLRSFKTHLVWVRNGGLSATNYKKILLQVMSKFMECSSFSGDLESLNWIRKEYETATLKEEDLIRSNHKKESRAAISSELQSSLGASLVYACRRNKVAVLNWFKNSNDFSAEIFNESLLHNLKHCFSEAASEGNVEILNWLKFESGVSEEAFHTEISDEFVRYLLGRFHGLSTFQSFQNWINEQNEQ